MAEQNDKAKQIRRGELDDDLPDCEVITGWIQRVPMTWLPGLFHAIAMQCGIRNVFRPGGMQSRLTYVEKIVAEGPNAVLREFADERCLQWVAWDKIDVSGFWWWDDGQLVVPVWVGLSSPGKFFFASTGQHGWNRSQKVSEMGGVWMKCDVPESTMTSEEKCDGT